MDDYADDSQPPTDLIGEALDNLWCAALDARACMQEVRAAGGSELTESGCPEHGDRLISDGVQ